MKSCVIPSVGEIFNVAGVAVGTDVDVASGVNVTGTCVGVFSGAKVTVDGGGVAALWQAARKKMKRKGMIFFIEFLLVGQACSPTFWRAELKLPPSKP